MTDEQKELVCAFQLSVIKAIATMDEEKIWELMKKAVESETEGSESKMTKEFNEREKFRHELHDKIGEQEWFGSEEFWVRVRDIEHMAADLHMRYKTESED